MASTARATQTSEPQTAPWTHDIRRAYDWGGQRFDFAQHKLDGWRATFFLQDDGSIKCFGRRQEPRLEMLERFPALARHPFVKNLRQLTPRTSVDCEITAVGEGRERVATALAGEPDGIEITAFALPFIGGERFVANPLRVREWAWHYGIPFVQTHNFAQLVDDGIIDASHAPDEIADALIQEAGMLGIEGWVLKTDDQYGDWWKVKAERTVDCVVTGIRPGRGRNDGRIGSLECSLKTACGGAAIVANVSGMSDDERNVTDWASLVGSVCEVRYERVSARGKLLLPRFVCWRPDKSADECGWEQLDAEGVVRGKRGGTSW